MFQTLFVLGGNDAEMLVIKALLSQAGLTFVQPNTAWGDHKYTPANLALEIEPSEEPRHDRPVRTEPRIKNLDLAVFIECSPMEWPKGTQVQVIDHHGERSGEPASIVQLLALLRRLPDMIREKTSSGNVYDQTNAATIASQIKEATTVSGMTRRWVELIAANDAGYIPAMLALGATDEEVSRVRAFDRMAQGITGEQEKQAQQGIKDMSRLGSRLTVVKIAHSKTATVTDRLYGKYDQLLILSGDGEVNFYGDGALCVELKEKFEGWNGGSGLGKAGANAFWGGYPSQDEVLAFVRQQLEK